jgi:hypothetical protein
VNLKIPILEPSLQNLCKFKQGYQKCFFKETSFAGITKTFYITMKFVFKSYIEIFVFILHIPIILELPKYSPWSKSGPLSTFVNKVLLEYGHIHYLTLSLVGLVLQYRGVWS